MSAAVRADYARNQAQRESLSPETLQLLVKETAIPAKVIQAYTMVNIHQAIMIYLCPVHTYKPGCKMNNTILKIHVYTCIL